MNTSRRKHPRGLTLIEMTVVILVILTLITVLFNGARAWVRGSDKASCILNIRKVQQAVRSYQNLNGLQESSSLNISTDLTGPGNFIETASVCPAGGAYTYLSSVPATGTLAMTCSFETSLEHVPADYSGW